MRRAFSLVSRRSARRFAAAALLGLVAVPARAPAQPLLYESEPNDTPLDGNGVAGEVTLLGTMTGVDQDAFIWTVSDDDARKRWTFELSGIPGQLTIVEILRVQLTASGDGVEDYTRLLKLGSRDGTRPAVVRDLIFEPGEYVIGLAQAGGSTGSSGAFRPPMMGLSFGTGGTPEGDAVAAAAQAEPAGAYRLTIREGSGMTVASRPSDNGAKETATAMRLGREQVGYQTGPGAWYAFTFDETAADSRWDISVQVPVGRSAEARLLDGAGATLATAASDDRGRIVFPDLAPGATTWYVELSTDEPGFIHSISSTAVGQRVPGEEAEPNGQWPLATRVDLGEPLTGRIGEPGDWDYFRFDLDEVTADQVLALNLVSEPAAELELCLYGGDGTSLKCQRGTAPLALSDLALEPGTWGIRVGRTNDQVAYRITLSEQGPIEPGVEAEPNDSVELATTVPANNRIRGRLNGSEVDVFRFVIADEPQLWRFQVVGDGISRVIYYDGSGKSAAEVRPGRGEGRVRLENLFLLPGQHFLSVTGSDGASYTVLARALGPPNPNAEREPNDDLNRTMRLAIGQTRTGLLAESADVDYYRFFLANWDRVRLTIAPPADGAVRPYLYWYGKPLAEGQPGANGEPIELEGLFPPGDYQLRLTAGQTSDAEYRVSLERLPRFSCPTDCEPTGVTALDNAAPLPASLVIEGNAGRWDDYDVYQLPALDEPGEVAVIPITAPREVRIARYIGDTNIAERDRTSGGWRAALPAGEAYRLIVRSDRQDYAVRLEFTNGPEARPAPAPLETELAMSFDTTEIAAYREYGQRVTGQLRVRNAAAAPVRLALAAEASDYRWQVSLGQGTVEVPPGAETAVPLDVLAPPDAWADRLVRISAMAEAEDGARVETWQEIEVGRDAPRVNPVRAYAVPDALRGGFNAAWRAVGAELHGEYPGSLGSSFEQVHDGITVVGNAAHFRARRAGGERPAMTLALAGDGPVPVAGIALNLFGSGEIFTDVRQATLLLSLDGERFDEVLTVHTLPVRTEQHFVLDAPVEARYARLRIDATFDRDPNGQINLGEWKVILSPGFDLSAGRGFNLADPALGGHVVWAEPDISVHWDSTVLTEELEKPSVRLHPGQDLEWVLGFHHNRVAAISRLEWLEDPSTSPESRFQTVTVAASIDSPAGPWIPVAEWALGPDRPAELELPEPVWARFLKFTAKNSGDRLSWWSAPDTLRVWERPTYETYRSILTEWGHATSTAYYESRQPLELEPLDTDAVNTSRDRAAPLTPGVTAASAVSRGQSEHWYRLAVPGGDNRLELRLAGDPSVRTIVTLETAAGDEVPLRRDRLASTHDLHVFHADVAGGTEYYLKVEEPPRNIVFSWDTSASVNAYLPTIYNAVATFAGEVVPEREAVNLVPFGLAPLATDYVGEPYILQTILNDHTRGSASSAAEGTLRRATQSLAPRAGTKAILLITDAATTRDSRVWRDLRTVRPAVFGIGIGGTRAANEEQDRFQDWTAVNGGHYTHLVYDGEMEVAFDRAVALLRRPATYELTALTQFEEAPGPGRLRVTSAEAGSGAAAASGRAVALILDASGSMLQRLDGRRRIEIARDVLTTAIREQIPAGTPLALRVFGHQEPNACRSDLEIPLAPLDPQAAASTIAGIQAMNLARTPIADSLAAVRADLGGAAESGAVIVLVTDGEETCDGDPGAVIAGLVESGLNVQVNIVGFAIGDPELEAQFADWAEQGGGRYLPASDQAGLNEALADALRVPFTVLDAGGEPVADGLVGDDGVELERGMYRVVVGSIPPVRFDAVEVAGEDEVTLTLPPR